MENKLLQKIPEFLNRPYPLDMSASVNLKNILIFSVSIFLFLYIFQPFGIGEEENVPIFLLSLGYGGVTALVTLLNWMISSKFLSGIFNESRWRIRDEILCTGWHILLIGLANSIFTLQISPHADVQIIDIVQMIGITFLVFLIPGTLYIGTNYTRELKKNLQQAELINQKIRQSDGSQFRQEKQVRFSSENGGEVIDLNPNQLLYLKSVDNYVQVFWQEGEIIRDSLLRNSLSRIEDITKGQSYLFRCHRSYLINLNKIKHVEGNSQGYKLMLVKAENPIPVARNRIKQLQEHLGVETSGHSLSFQNLLHH